MYIDDVQINATSSYCPPPTNVLATSLNATTAEVTWTPVGTETQWEFAYKQSSSSTWITNITNAPTYTIDSLTTTTSYTIKVRAICDQVQSPYSNPVTYTHLQTYSIFTTHDANCSINPTGVLVVPQGSDTTFHFSANAGYIVSEVRVDGVVLNPTPTSYTFENINSNHEINLFSLLSNNVNENSPLFVQLMPNPAHSFIELKVDINLLKSNIGKIYNFYGQNVKELMINNEKMVIDISDLSVGVYLVFLETKQGIYTIKFVKD